MFSIVKTRKGKKCKFELSVVPSNWVGNNCVFWPPNELVTLSRDNTSKPEMTWKPTSGKVLATAETFDLAEAKLAELVAQTDSEDQGIGTRAKPAAKKPKFVSSSYDIIEECALTPTTTAVPVSTAALQMISVAPSSALVSTAGLSGSGLTTVTSGSGNCAPGLPGGFVAGTSGLSFDLQRGLVVATTDSGNLAAGLQQDSATVVPRSSNLTFELMATSDSSNLATVLEQDPATTVSFGPIMASTSTPLQRNKLTVKPTKELVSDTTTSGSQPKLGVVPTLFAPTNLITEFATQVSTSKPSSAMVLQGNAIAVKPGDDLPEVVFNEDDPPVQLQAHLSGTEIQISTQNGIHSFIQLDDGSILPVSNTEQINAKLDANHNVLVKIFDFMANIDRFLRKTNHAETLMDDMNAAESEECARLLKIKSVEDLTLLEQKLQNASFAARLLKHCKSVYMLSGKRDGNAFFKTFMRDIMDPVVLKNYSWQGNSRSGANESFRETFPGIIQFVFHVIRAADFQFTNEANGKSFQSYLRMKNVEIQRYNAEGKHRRTAFSRKRKINQEKAPAIQDDDDSMMPDDARESDGSDDENDVLNERFASAD